ncbi:hypothetical protein [Streptomyces sp. NPDC004008]
MDVAVLREITVVLGRAGGGKWHVPASGSRWHSHCRYAERLTGAPLVLLDVVEQVCQHCAPLVVMAPGEEALWLASAEVVEADNQVRKLQERAVGARSWDGYAQVLWEAARHRDAALRARLEPWTADSSFGAGARELLRGWGGVLERSEAALAAWRAAAPAAREATSVSGACDVVAADGQVRQAGLQLAAAVVDRSRWAAKPFDAWAVVRRAWSSARDRGMGAAQARTAAMQALEAHWGAARVRDVTALPEPVPVPADGFSSPAQWADAEFQHRWQRYVVECCDRLEQALHAAASGEPAAGRQLLLVTGWPLVRPQDAELAYLAQYEQHGPTVPFGGRRNGYGWEPDHAVVLAVPRFAAQHAAEHTRDHPGRIVVRPDLDAKGPDEQEVLTLLRGAYPYLEVDAERDGAGAEPTSLVAKARAVRRDARPAMRAGRGGLDSIERYNDLVVGAYTWVPDDNHPGAAAAELAEVPIHWLGGWTLWMDVECGARPQTVLRRLYGTATSFDPDTGRIGFSPTGGHAAIAVPVHRIVALSGDRRRRGPGEVPAHEPVDEL